MSLRDIDRKYWESLVLFSFSFVFLLMFVIKTPLNGDTYVYARSIKTFEGPIIHIGYFLICNLAHYFFNFFGCTPLETLAYISVFFGSLCVVCMYLFTFILTENHLQSLLSALILMFSGTFWFFSIHGEVYVPQLAFVLISVLFMIRKRPLLSSMAILVAISITPTSCLAIPPLIFLIYLKKMDKRKIVYFMLPIIIAIFFLALWDISRIIEILNWAIYSPKVFFEYFSVKLLIQKVVYNLIKAYGKSFNLVSFLAILGFAILFKENKKIWWLMLVFFLPFSLYLLNLGLFSDDHLIISFIPISFLASFGITYLLRIKNTSLPITYLAIVFILFCQLLISYQLFARPEMRDAKELKRVINNLSDKYKTNGVMISDYNFGMAFWYLTKEEKNFYILTGRPNKLLPERGGDVRSATKKLQKEFWVNIPYLPKFVRQINFNQLLDERPIYYVDRSDWPSWIVQLLLSDESLQKRKRDLPKLIKLKAYLGENLDVKIVSLKIIDSPSHPVYRLHKI